MFRRVSQGTRRAAVFRRVSQGTRRSAVSCKVPQGTRRAAEQSLRVLGGQQKSLSGH